MSEVLVYPEKKRIVIPFREDAANLIPSAQRAQVRDVPILIVPHRRDEVRLLRNLGMQVPAPILHQYDWEGDTPFQSQRETAALLTTNSRAYVLNDMGTGKTRATLHAAHFLMQQGEVRKALVIAPLSTLTMVWENELFEHFPDRTAVILHGTRNKRIERLNQGADFYIINHDGVHTIREELKARTDIDLVIIDELAVYRNARTRRWKAAEVVVRGRKFAWGLTGAPTPNGPPDAWAQCRLLTPSSVPAYFKRWRDATMLQVSNFRWVPRAGAAPMVHAAMQPSVRFTREDCIDLPETLHSTRTVQLSKEQKSAYDLLMRQLRAEFDAGKLTTANEGVRLTKLLQIACGFIYLNDGAVQRFDSKDRLATLQELIEENANKTIVFIPFVEAVDAVHSFVSKFTTAEKVYGNTPVKDRNRIFAEFQRATNPRVIVAHPKCMAHGLTLTAASCIVWYSPLSDLDIYEQANARITRPGQKHKTLVVHLEGTPVERRAFASLRQKGKMQGTLLGLFKGIDEGLGD